MNVNKIEEKSLQDNDQSNYDLWSRMFDNQEAPYLQIECNKDDNVDVDVW